jgi:hypothetical protein
MKIEPDLWEVLANPNSEFDVNSANVQFALVPDIAERIGRKVTTEIQPNDIAITF